MIKAAGIEHIKIAVEPEDGRRLPNLTPVRRDCNGWLLGMAALGLGLVYAFCIPPGTPADEPSHFDTVQWYARHWQLPVIGDSGVSYEGQMGPVYYFVAALIYRVLRVTGDQAAFYAIRLSGLLLLIPAVHLTYQIARELAPARPDIAIIATLFTALNPSLMAIFASVQNDAVAIVVSLLVTRICLLGKSPAGSHWSHPALVAVITSFAILAKATALFLVPSVVAYWFFTRHRQAIRDVAIFGTIVVALTGWWFFRNHVLYGDFTAQRALREHGFLNAPSPIALWHPRELFDWLWGIQSSYWLPTEYFRGIFHAPVWLRGVVLVLSVMAAVGCIFSARSRRLIRSFGRRPLFLLVLEYAACLAVYLYSCIRVTHFSPRTTFPTFIVYAMGIGVGLGFVAQRYGKAGRVVVYVVLFGGLLAGNIYCLIAIRRAGVMPFTLFVS